MAQDPNIGREILPIPDIPVRADPALHASDTAAPPIHPLRPPAEAPNVLIVLIDDMGFGATSAFGGPCHMPTLERLAGGEISPLLSLVVPDMLSAYRRIKDHALNIAEVLSGEK